MLFAIARFRCRLAFLQVPRFSSNHQLAIGSGNVLTRISTPPSDRLLSRASRAGNTRAMPQLPAIL
jgi:hypothetical protein